MAYLVGTIRVFRADIIRSQKSGYKIHMIRRQNIISKFAVFRISWQDHLTYKFYASRGIGEEGHIRTCAPLFRISETAGRSVLKFDAWLGTHQLCISRKSHVGYTCTCALAHPFSVSLELDILIVEFDILIGTE